MYRRVGKKANFILELQVVPFFSAIKQQAAYIAIRYQAHAATGVYRWQLVVLKQRTQPRGQLLLQGNTQYRAAVVVMRLRHAVPPSHGDAHVTLVPGAHTSQQRVSTKRVMGACAVAFSFPLADLFDRAPHSAQKRTIDLRWCDNRVRRKRCTINDAQLSRRHCQTATVIIVSAHKHTHPTKGHMAASQSAVPREEGVLIGDHPTVARAMLMGHRAIIACRSFEENVDFFWRTMSVCVMSVSPTKIDGCQALRQSKWRMVYF